MNQSIDIYSIVVENIFHYHHNHQVWIYNLKFKFSNEFYISNWRKIIFTWHHVTHMTLFVIDNFLTKMTAKKMKIQNKTVTTITLIIMNHEWMTFFVNDHLVENRALWFFHFFFIQLEHSYTWPIDRTSKVIMNFRMTIGFTYIHTHTTYIDVTVVATAIALIIKTNVFRSFFWNSRIFSY